jgi:hypothetical protein
VGLPVTMMTLRKFGKILMFFGNFLLKKPDNNLEGISAHYKYPNKRLCSSGSQAILEWVAWFPFFLNFTFFWSQSPPNGRASEIRSKPLLSLPGMSFVNAHEGGLFLRHS